MYLDIRKCGHNPFLCNCRQSDTIFHSSGSDIDFRIYFQSILLCILMVEYSISLKICKHTKTQAICRWRTSDTLNCIHPIVWRCNSKWITSSMDWLTITYFLVCCRPRQATFVRFSWKWKYRRENIKKDNHETNAISNISSNKVILPMQKGNANYIRVLVNITVHTTV